MKDEIFKRIDALAAKLGVAANGVWNVLVAQARVEAIKELIGLGVAGGLGILGIGMLIWAVRKANAASNRCDGDVETFWGVTAVISGIVALISVIYILCCATSWITPMYNPQYWALQQIMNLMESK